jgi:hypothetical protein
MSNIFDDIFDTSNEEKLLNSDKAFSGGNKIEKSGIFMVKVNMAKQVDSSSSASKNFKIEMETEDGARLYWEAGWYITKDGSMTNKDGKPNSATVHLAQVNYMLTGQKGIPELVSKKIKEYDWELKQDVEVTRMIAPDMIGKFIKVKVERVRLNKKVDSGKVGKDGYKIYVDGPEERFVNDVTRFYDAATGQTFGEKLINKEPTAIIEDEAFCKENPIIDKYKEVAPVASSASTASTTTATTGASATAGFGS